MVRCSKCNREITYEIKDSHVEGFVFCWDCRFLFEKYKGNKLEEYEKKLAEKFIKNKTREKEA